MMKQLGVWIIPFAPADGQKALANSQAVAWELMGMVVHDNFNFKDENHKLSVKNRSHPLKTTAALQHQIAQLVQLAR